MLKIITFKKHKLTILLLFCLIVPFSSYNLANSANKELTSEEIQALENKTIEQLIKEFFDLYRHEIKIKDSKYENEKTYLNYLKDHVKITVLFNRISNYISNKISTNIVDPKFNKMNNEFSYQCSLLSKELGSETVRIFQHEKKLKQ